MTNERKNRDEIIEIHGQNPYETSERRGREAVLEMIRATLRRKCQTVKTK